MSDFLPRELALFARYTVALQDLAVKEGVVVEGVLPSHTCSRCARKVPAGIPGPFKGTQYDLCPVCVEVTEIVCFPPREGALDAQFAEGLGTFSEEKAKALGKGSGEASVAKLVSAPYVPLTEFGEAAE